MRNRLQPRHATPLYVALSLLGASQAASARADCTDDLVEKVFAHHATDPTIDSKMALHAWLCEGASDTFLAQHATLPTGINDQAAWQALLDEIDADTDIGTLASVPTTVTQFRSANCANPSKRYLIHALGRVATSAEFETWHACDAAATRATNASSGFFDLGLSCAGQQGLDGKLNFSVRGFDAQDSNATSPLTNLAFTLQNLSAPVDYSHETILSGVDKSFSFSVVNDAQDASVSMTGTADTDFGPVSYFCSLDLGQTTSTSKAYVLRGEVECAFEAPRPGNTSCPAGKLQEACVNGHWQDTATCVPDRLNLTVSTAAQGGGTGSVILPDGSTCNGQCTLQADKLSEVRLRGQPGASTRIAWVGCSRIEANDCVVSMTAPATVSATFVGQTLVTVNNVGQSGGSGSIALPDGRTCGAGQCSYSADTGSEVRLRAFPGGTSRLTWSGCSRVEMNDCVVTASQPTAVTATFAGMSLVTISVVGNGAGSVSMPSGAQCPIGRTCQEWVERKPSLTINANPSGFMHVYWTGCTVGANQSTCTASANGNVNVTVNIVELVVIRVLNAGAAGNGVRMPSGEACDLSTCIGIVDKGTTARITAMLADRYRVTWTGCSSVSGDTCNVSMSASKEVKATFSRIPGLPPPICDRINRNDPNMIPVCPVVP